VRHPRSTALVPSLLAFLALAPDARAQSPASAAAPATPAASAILATMRSELARAMDALKSQPTPPYFLSYSVTERRAAQVRGSDGAVVAADDERGRALSIDLRVGSPRFDNTHSVEGGMGRSFFMRSGMASVPVDDDTLALRHVIWRETDRRYKRAVEQFLRVKTEVQLRVVPEDTSPDFAPAPAARHIEATASVRYDRADWERRVREYTRPFAEQPDIFGATAELSAVGDTRWYVNSDGSELQTATTYYRLMVSAYARADDGMLLPRYESYVATTPEGLPSDSAVMADVAQVIADLRALKRAPVLGAATAPAILRGRASGVFFHEVFGHRLEGHRAKQEDDAQTFTGKVGERLLPAGFSVFFDPTLQRLGGTELAGQYAYDDEGVKARRVDVVRDGIFRTFLMSRSPIAGFSESNGHGRGEPGEATVARQSNLVVATARPLSRAALKQRLLAEIKRQGKPFGLIFDDIEGGFTLTTRDAPNAFEVMPVMVYRVFPDGREQLVRGVDLIGTPLTVFSRIVAAGGPTQVFNGVCGAESGAVPVSASSPDILISQIEVQRKEKSQEQAPILPPPVEAKP
jgi:predicted Zn-dependent protease